MKSVLRSAKPYWIYLILTGKKTIEVGKDFPKAEDWDKVVEMYCSKNMRSFNRIPEKDREWMRKYLGKVACRFVCDRIDRLYIPYSTSATPPDKECVEKATCLSYDELKKYAHGKMFIYGWDISDLKIYDTPKELWLFNYPCPGKECSKCRYKVRDKLPFGKIGVDCGRYHITRPPQSWCYVL